MTHERAQVNATTPAPRVLVVDDDPTTCTFCALALKQIGYTALPITDADEGLRILLAEGPFDLLLTDIQMPGHSGIELAQIAREHDPAIAVIIMTGHTNIDTLRESARQGIANFLAKPFEIEELQLAVSQALHKRELLQEQVRLRALERLLLSSEAINSILDREALAQVILERARGLLPASAAFLYLPSDDRRTAHLVADPSEAQLSDAGKMLLEQASTAARPLYDAQPALAILHDQTLDGGLIAPLRTGGAYLGALLLCAGDTLSRPDSSDMIALLANQAGPALRNAHLYGELERAYRELAELDRMKSEFIAIASHELRSPLSLVIGYTRMLRDRGEGQTREFAQRALEGAEKMTTIVNDITRLRDHDLQSTNLNREPLLIVELLQQAIERFQEEASARNQQIILEAADPTLQLWADREKVHLIVGNLLSNATTFTANDGTITVHVAPHSHQDVVQAAQAAATNPSLRRIGEIGTQEWLVIAVCDTGIGVPPEQQSRIFERFYQVASSLTRSHGGVGLGLALVAELVIQHDGLIWLDARVAEGSCFRVALPIKPAVL